MPVPSRRGLPGPEPEKELEDDTLRQDCARLHCHGSDNVVTAGSAALTPRELLLWGREAQFNLVEIRHAQLKYLSVGLKLKLSGPSDLFLVT